MDPLKGQCPDYAHARVSSIFSPKDNGTVILTRQDFLPDRTADGDLLFIFSSNILDFPRSLSSYIKILLAVRVVLNPAKRDANGFFKVLLLSSHLLISRHPVQKSKFGASALTRYCSFNYNLLNKVFSPLPFNGAFAVVECLFGILTILIPEIKNACDSFLSIVKDFLT